MVRFIFLFSVINEFYLTFASKQLKMPEWFEDWFDSKYYHFLYRQRDDREAQLFIGNLVAHLALSKGSRILDLACGRGRHSRYLNELGFDVVGADLSADSIKHARETENDTLKFVVADMRKPLETESFDVVMNLFTSFGYFENKQDNEKVLSAIHHQLVGEGLVVIDFLNAIKVQRQLVREEQKTCSGINFTINREVKDGHVVKTIRFSDAGQDFMFTEKVQLLTLADFMNLFKNTGFKTESVFGDYNLGKFDPENSERLILVARKTTL